MNENNIREKYKKYCRPKVSQLLETIRLDKVYHKAEGDYIYYNDEDKEIKVIDFLGGYGASLFGHNNPALVDIAILNYKNKLPFNAQASCRGNAANLCEKLNSILHRSTNRNFITTLASTGTECAEAAIKHAELTYYKKIETLHEKIDTIRMQLLEQFRSGELSISNQFYNIIHEKLGMHPSSDYKAYISAAMNHNYRIFKKSPVFLSLEGSFHGKTSGAVQLTHYEEFRLPFERVGVDVIFIEPGDNDKLNEIIDSIKLNYFWPMVNENNEITIVEKEYVNISAFFIEPIQGEGGIRPLSVDFLKHSRKICDKFAIPLVFDEIQSGMGRTGTFLASEDSGVVADYYLLSKSLGGGMAKVSAIMVHDELYENEFGFIHSSTFSEDDPSSSISLAALNLIESDNIMEKCRNMGEYIKSGLEKIHEKYPHVIKAVRGVGLMIGVEFEGQETSGSLALQMISKQSLLGYMIAGYLLHEYRIRVAPTMSSAATIRFEPSAYISKEDCDSLFVAMDRLCEVIYKQNVYEFTRFIVGAEKLYPTDPVKNYRKEFKPYRRVKGARRVALLTHIILYEQLALFDDSFENFTPEQCRQFIEQIYTSVKPQVYEHYIIDSDTGDQVDLCTIGIFMDSNIFARHMLEGNLEPVHNLVEEAMQLAINEGYHVISFGGFTSIVTRNCTTLTTDSISLTSGNSLTVAMGLEALHKAAKKKNIDISTSCLAAIGANGNICSIYSEIMAEEVPKLILIGRKGGEERLKSIASDIYSNSYRDILSYEEFLKHPDDDSDPVTELKGVTKVIYETETIKELIKNRPDIDNIGRFIHDRLGSEMKDDVPVKVTSDYNQLKEANLIVSASNSPAPVIFPEMLGNGPIIINDIAVPEDCDRSVAEARDDVMIISGGLVRLPYNPDLKIQGMPIDKGHVFPCMAEAILLGMMGSREHYSYGRISKIQVKKIMEISRVYGFKLGEFKVQRSF